MKLFHNEDPFPHIYIENTYDEDELEAVWRELLFLCESYKLDPPTETGGAINSQGRMLKKNNCVWLTDVYKNLKYSDIHLVNRKIFDNVDEIFGKHSSWFFKHLYANFEATLISYYEDSDYYEPHEDRALITGLTWFFREPKMFSGGNLHFPTFDYTIEVKNNTSIFFPSCLTHAVDEIKMNKKDMFNQNGRFCMSQFLSVVPQIQ